MRLFIQNLFADFVELVFPTACLGCGQVLTAGEVVLCTKCRFELPETGHHRPGQQDLSNKFAGKIPVTAAYSFLHFTKDGIVQRLIHRIKYNGRKEAGREVARWYGNQLATENQTVAKADMLVGVPLHKSRLRQRGYNQADWIAEGLAEGLGVSHRTDVLVRVKFAGSQTRRNRVERWQNVKTVFAVAKPDDVKDKHVVVVDDVMTTGATVEACAVELLKAGCREVSVLTLAATR
jgi:ComF family protein